MSEPETNYKTRQSAIDEFLRQSKHKWTKEEWFEALDNKTLCCFPTSVEKIEWTDEWYKLHPKEKIASDNQVYEHEIEMFNTYNIRHIFLKMFLKDKKNDFHDHFFMEYLPQTEEIKITSIASFKTHKFKL